MFKLDRRNRQIIVVIIGVITIAIGLLQNFGILKMDPRTSSRVTMVLFILAFALLFAGRGNNQDNRDSSEDMDAGGSTDADKDADSSVEAGSGEDADFANDTYSNDDANSGVGADSDK